LFYLKVLERRLLVVQVPRVALIVVANRIPDVEVISGAPGGVGATCNYIYTLLSLSQFAQAGALYAAGSDGSAPVGAGALYAAGSDGSAPVGQVQNINPEDHGALRAPSNAIQFKFKGGPIGDNISSVVSYLVKKNFIALYPTVTGGQGLSSVSDILYRNWGLPNDLVTKTMSSTATMSEYHENFKIAKGSTCLADREADFEKLGLPASQLDNELKPGP
jgi:hypothetical protein